MTNYFIAMILVKRRPRDNVHMIVILKAGTVISLIKGIYLTSFPSVLTFPENPPITKIYKLYDFWDCQCPYVLLSIKTPLTIRK